MARKQKSYTLEFKQQIVDLYNTGETSYPKLEPEYGVPRANISGWVLGKLKGLYHSLNGSKTIFIPRGLGAT